MKNNVHQIRISDKNSKSETKAKANEYHRITSINGKHPWQEKVDNGCILYSVRTRPHGKVRYFNFALAKEMGMIRSDHPHKITAELEKTLLDTFALQIINEYDIINHTKIDPTTIKPHKYMATRYLQLQHPNKMGKTSGDGRSIWNGYWKGNGKTWDISSCGTGATCLSPATAAHKRFFKTGDPSISYGCGFADLADGLETAIFSEILRKNNIATEQCLCVIEFPGDLAVNVRAGLNLLRPSHFFNHLKQGAYDSLKSGIDLFIERQLQNKTWETPVQGVNKYDLLLDQITRTFSEMAAKFEAEYIFCWLAWDGDNILTDGSIIDFGSIRQFGLFHHEYRYDDVERWSTTITEQKKQARYIVQTFAQIVDYLKTKKKKNISVFKKSNAVKLFEQNFRDKSLLFLLGRMGFETSIAEKILKKHDDKVVAFQKVFSYFERQISYKGIMPVADGISADAIFSMRDILRELPRKLRGSSDYIEPANFLEIMKSDYAKKKDIKLNLKRRFWTLDFQRRYRDLVEVASQLSHTSPQEMIEKIYHRARIINRPERVTGDSICHIAERITKHRKATDSASFHRLVEEFVEDQILVPENRTKPLENEPKVSPKNAKVFKSLVKVVKELKQSI